MARSLNAALMDKLCKEAIADQKKRAKRLKRKDVANVLGTATHGPWVCRILHGKVTYRKNPLHIKRDTTQQIGDF